MNTSIVALDEKKLFTKDEIALFEKKYLLVCQQLSEAIKEIKSLQNDFIKFTRIDASSGKQTIDIDKMRKEEPKLFAELLVDYPKISGAKKAYVKIEVR